MSWASWRDPHATRRIYFPTRAAPISLLYSSPRHPRRRRSTRRCTAAAPSGVSQHRRGRGNGLRHADGRAAPTRHRPRPRDGGLHAHRRCGSLSRHRCAGRAAPRRSPDRLRARVAPRHRAGRRHPTGRVPPSRRGGLTRGDRDVDGGPGGPHHQGRDRPQARAVPADSRLQLRRFREVRGSRPGEAGRFRRFRPVDHGDADHGVLGAARPLPGDDPRPAPVEQFERRGQPGDRGRDRELQPRADRAPPLFARLAHRRRRAGLLHVRGVGHAGRGGAPGVPPRAPSPV